MSLHTETVICSAAGSVACQELTAKILSRIKVKSLVHGPFPSLGGTIFNDLSIQEAGTPDLFASPWHSVQQLVLSSVGLTEALLQRYHNFSSDTSCFLHSLMGIVMKNTL